MFALGSIETVTGAAGGVRYRPVVSPEAARKIISELCAELSGQHIRYTQEYGLVCERIGDDNEF